MYEKFEHSNFSSVCSVKMSFETDDNIKMNQKI
jgi:hypothetical protein